MTSAPASSHTTGLVGRGGANVLGPRGATGTCHLRTIRVASRSSVEAIDGESACDWSANVAKLRGSACHDTPRAPGCTVRCSSCTTDPTDRTQVNFFGWDDPKINPGTDGRDGTGYTAPAHGFVQLEHQRPEARPGRKRLARSCLPRFAPATLNLNGNWRCAREVQAFLPRNVSKF